MVNLDELLYFNANILTLQEFMLHIGGLDFLSIRQTFTIKKKLIHLK